jgi:outer membrane receptor protein involved in Fe transport
MIVGWTNWFLRWIHYSPPLLYHLGSSASIINSDLLERIDLYPSNFSVRYGRATGGVVDATIRAPKTDRLHAYIDADFWDVSALVESPIGKNWSVAASARRSYIDNIIEAISYSYDGSEVTVAPRYYDFQIVADYHPHARDNLRMFVFGTDDLEVEIENAMKTSINHDYHSFTYQAQLQWEHGFSDNCDNRFDLGFGYWASRNNTDETNENWDIWPLLIRDEFTWRHSDKFVLRVGTDTEFRFGKIKMKVLEYHGVENEFLDTSSYDLKWIEFEGNRFYAEPAGYTELELTVIPKTRFIYGVRADYYSSNKKWGIDPRVAIRFNPHDTSTLKAGLGLFHQPPGMIFGDKDQGNPNLDLTSAIHFCRCCFLLRCLGIAQDRPGYRISRAGCPGRTRRAQPGPRRELERPMGRSEGGGQGRVVCVVHLLEMDGAKRQPFILRSHGAATSRQCRKRRSYL